MCATSTRRRSFNVPPAGSSAAGRRDGRASRSGDAAPATRGAAPHQLGLRAASSVRPVLRVRPARCASRASRALAARVATRTRDRRRPSPGSRAATAAPGADTPGGVRDRGGKPPGVGGPVYRSPARLCRTARPSGRGGACAFCAGVLHLAGGRRPRVSAAALRRCGALAEDLRGTAHSHRKEPRGRMVVVERRGLIPRRLRPVRVIRWTGVRPGRGDLAVRRGSDAASPRGLTPAGAHGWPPPAGRGRPGASVGVVAWPPRPGRGPARGSGAAVVVAAGPDLPLVRANRA